MDFRVAAFSLLAILGFSAVSYEASAAPSEMPRACHSLFSAAPTAQINNLPLLAMGATLPDAKGRGFMRSVADTWRMGDKVSVLKRVDGHEVLTLEMGDQRTNLPIRQLIKSTRLSELVEGERNFPRDLLVQFPVAQFFANINKWVQVPVVGMISDTSTMKGVAGPKVTAYYATGEVGQYNIEAAFLPQRPYEHVGVLIRSRLHNDTSSIFALVKAAANETRQKYPEFKSVVHPYNLGIGVSALYIELADNLGAVRSAQITVDPKTLATKAVEMESPNTLFLQNLFALLVKAN